MTQSYPLAWERTSDLFGAHMPPEIRDLAMNRGLTVLRIAGQFVFWLVIGSAFSTLGGILGAAIFAKKPLPGAAPGTIDVPPVA